MNLKFFIPLCFPVFWFTQGKIRGLSGRLLYLTLQHRKFHPSCRAIFSFKNNKQCYDDLQLACDLKVVGKNEVRV